MHQNNNLIQEKKENTKVPAGNAAGKNKGVYLADNRNKAGVQKKENTQEMENKAVQLKPVDEVAQLSGNSKKANEEMRRAMGASARLVNKLPNAKPHTKRGTGGGGGGTDHQGRDAMVINKAKQDTRRDEHNPTMFASSQMRMGNEKHTQKEKYVEEERKEKTKSKKQSELEEIREYYGYKSTDQLTKDEIDAYREAMQ